MGRTKSLEIMGSSNIGLFGYTTDTYCLIGKALGKETTQAFTSALDVPLHKINIGGSQQIGAYVTGNDDILLVPSVINEHEKEELNELGIKYAIIETKNTALGNNLIIGKNCFFYMNEFEENAIKQIEEALGFSGEVLELEDWEVIGSIVVINKKGGLIQKDVPENIINHIQEKLGIELEKGTINFGSHVIGGGIVVNSNGMVIGRASAGIEVTNADMAFGFLEK